MSAMRNQDRTRTCSKLFGTVHLKLSLISPITLTHTQLGLRLTIPPPDYIIFISYTLNIRMISYFSIREANNIPKYVNATNADINKQL